jgi:hypothetical protein
MSKKHFIALAQALANSRPYGSLKATVLTDRQVTQVVQWQRDVQAIAEVCDSMSPAFDYRRFIDACEQWEAK